MRTKRLQVVGSGEAREAKARIGLEQINKLGCEPGRLQVRFKTAGPFCSVLFRHEIIIKKKNVGGPRNHWVDTTCLIHFITEKKNTTSGKRSNVDRFFSSSFKHNLSLCLNDPARPLALC